jgi:hypothetical protein
MSKVTINTDSIDRDAVSVSLQVGKDGINIHLHSWENWGILSSSDARRLAAALVASADALDAKA